MVRTTKYRPSTSMHISPISHSTSVKCKQGTEHVRKSQACDRNMKAVRHKLMTCLMYNGSVAKYWQLFTTWTFRHNCTILRTKATGMQRNGKLLNYTLLHTMHDQMFELEPCYTYCCIKWQWQVKWLTSKHGSTSNESKPESSRAL